MKKTLLSLSGLLFSLLLAAQGNPLEVRQTVLSNGMEVWINEDHSQPIVFGAVVVKAGGKDSPDTGLAHYLEHLLFKGTTELGTVDYAAEKVWLDSIAACYDRLSTTTAQEARLAIQKEINRLSIKAAEYAIPNEFDRLTAEFGGTGLNAATSYDYTYYFNTFSPQYMAQWAELNSHRMMQPVFRLFQGELETVYEEKNRSADNALQAPMFEMIKEFSGSNPYSYPVIGSTENLKNPRLGEMMDFFNKYYVGCNMGLILSGDLDGASLQPLLERTFGRIRRGEKPEKAPVEAPALSGRRDVKIKADIPLIKVSVFAFNGPKEADADAPALDLATQLLTNSFSSGLMDSLVTAHKVLMAGAMRVPLFNEMGIAGFAVIPSLPFGSLPKSEKMCWEQIEKIKRGEFSDAAVEALKFAASKQALGSLETIGDRSAQMVSAMSQGRSWDAYLRQVGSIRDITREDIIRVARKYFNENYIRFEKVKGNYEKDKVAKPDFDPIIPPHAAETSAYAAKLESMPVEDRPARMLDFNNDIERVALNDHVSLYYKQNPVNDIFDLQIRIDKGSAEDPAIPHAAALIGTSGTDSLSIQQLSRAWQQLGTTFFTDSGNHSFSLNISGFDNRLDASLALLRHIIDHARADKKSFQEIKTGITLEKQTFFKGGTSNLMSALQQRVFFGEESPLLTQMTVKELDKLGMEGLMRTFSGLMDCDYTIFYSGSLPKEAVTDALRSRLDLSRPGNKPARKDIRLRHYDEPTVFFYNLPGSRQAQIMTYQTSGAPASGKEQAMAELLGEYIGGGMFSLMFQEVREFRAMAYSASGAVSLPDPIQRGESALLYTSLGTQADKSLAAMQLVDSLLNTMPLREKGLRAATRSLQASANNKFPSFRDLGKTVRNMEIRGYQEDPTRSVIENLGSITQEDLRRYYDQSFRTAARSYIIVGDKKNLPMDEIGKFGKIIEFTKEQVYR